MRTRLWPDTDDEHVAELQAFFAGQAAGIEQVYVIVTDSGLGGFIELNIRHFAEGSRNPEVPYVEGWYVEPEYRGKGYGSLLMQRAEQWARDLGYTELASDTWVDNRHSIALHRHLGFEETERVVYFLKNLKA